MFNWSDLKNLLVVKHITNLLYRWWEIDVTIIEEKNLQKLLSKEHLIQFKNPVLNTFFENEAVIQSFIHCLQTKQKAGDKPGHLVKWNHTGLHLSILPLQLHEQFSRGFIVIGGFLTNSNQVPETLNKWVNIGFKKNWCNTNIKHVPIIENKDKKYLFDLVEDLNKEILTIQSEIFERDKNIKSIHRRSNTLCYGDLVGKSKAMQKLYALLDKIKFSNNTILIEGENGTGKELIAKSIHQNSQRKNQIFLAQNCSALNDNLLESELFGHVKGAFTGAYKNKKGLFEQADKGTFFLDEIGDTSLGMQVKILRVLQEGTFFPVGGVVPKKVDVRIIAATNRNLQKMIEKSEFREDLYYRLNVINIQVPPLRERKEDIPLLAEFFINRFSNQMKAFTKKAMKKLTQYPWPGNVRELQNEADRLAIFSGNETYIKEEFLSEKIKNLENNNISDVFNKQKNIMKTAIADLERKIIARCLVEEGWNKTRVSKKLGISRAALIAKIKFYKIQPQSINKKMIIRRKF